MELVRYYDNGDITTKVEFVYSGQGINAQEVFHKFITTFSIARGVIIDREYVRCKVFCR